MPWIRANRDPNSQRSLYGDTRPGIGADAWLADQFWQNPDGSFLPGKDPSQEREAAYWNADGMQGGGNVYSDRYERLDNPEWWAYAQRNPMFAGKDVADIQDIYSDPAKNKAFDDAKLKNYIDNGFLKKTSGSGLSAFLGDLGKFFGPTIGLGLGMGGGFGGLLGDVGAAGVTGSAADLAAEIAAADAASGAALSSGSYAPFLEGGTLGGAGAGSTLAGGGNVSLLDDFASSFGEGYPSWSTNTTPGFDVNSLFNGDIPLDLIANAGLPGAGSVNPGNWLDPYTGGGPGTSGLKEIVDKIRNIPGGSSILQRLFNGQATPADYTQLLGTLGSAGLAALSANQQQNALSSTANKYLELGAPYRERLNASYAPGFTLANEPGYKDAIDQAMQSFLRKASTGGNPFENPGVSQEILKGVNAGLTLPQLNTYRSQLGSFGQLGTNTAGTADLAATQQAGGVANALQSVLGTLTTPVKDTSEDDLMNRALRSYLVTQFSKGTSL